MAPRSPQPPDWSDELRDVATLVFHELHSVLKPAPPTAPLDRVDRDHVGHDAAVELLVSQGILSCRQIHRIGSTTGSPDEELAFLNLSMLDVALNRIPDLTADEELSARLEVILNRVQDLMLRLGKDYGSFDGDD